MMINFSNLQIVKNHNNQSLDDLVKQQTVVRDQLKFHSALCFKGTHSNIHWDTQEIIDATRIEEWYEAKESKKVLLFFHGFYAEHSAKHDWHPYMKKIGQKYGCSVYALIWPTNIFSSHFSVDFFDMILGLVISRLLSLKTDFDNAVLMADLISNHINEIIKSIPNSSTKDIFLIGHSLGGRIVLNTTSQPSDYIKGGLALAPAISQYEFNSPVLDSLITCSDHDFILKYLYPLAKEATVRKHKGPEIAIGYAGCLQHELEINLDHLKMGHLDYTTNKFKEVLKDPKIKRFLTKHLTIY